MSGPVPVHPADTDRNLLFGVLALQADLIDKNQFAEVCGAWAARNDKPLADSSPLPALSARPACFGRRRLSQLIFRSMECNDAM
jgi:hypothetical protein